MVRKAPDKLLFKKDFCFEPAHKIWERILNKVNSEESVEKSRNQIEEAEKDLSLGEKALEQILSEANNKENCERKNELIQGAKYDNGKPKLSTVPTGIIYAIERVRAYGFAKYKEAENWKSIDPKRWHEAFLRHTLKIWEDPAAIDPESGMPHLWHLACNLDFMIESMNLKPEDFDRRKETDTCATDITEVETLGGDTSSP